MPEGVEPVDLKDPQNMNNNNCISYLELLVDRFKGQMDAAMAKGERPTSRVKSMWMDCTKRKGNIISAV